MALLTPASPSLRLARSLVALACLALGAAARARGQAAPGDLEQQVKAAYLLNFTRYVDWPGGVFAGDDDPVTLCVVAPPGFDLVVRSTVEGRRSRGRPVTVVVPDTPAQAAECHVAFLSPAEGLGPWMAALRGSHTLTVGEGGRFLQRGGMVSFVIVEETVRFEVNQAAALAAGLHISSRVLALATRVVGG